MAFPALRFVDSSRMRSFCALRVRNYLKSLARCPESGPWRRVRQEAAFGSPVKRTPVPLETR
jgi:hypothetical protein